MKFTGSGCPDLKWGWGTHVGAECSDPIEFSGNPVSFTPYMHRHGQYKFPAGFVIGTADQTYAFGQTGTDAEAQDTKPIEGNIVGFNVVQSGNVDYWGLVVAKKGEVPAEKPTVVLDKSKTPPCEIV